MERKLKLLDLFCGEGGAGMGYHYAGFDVTGVDIRPQPRYPLRFVKADAFQYLCSHGWEYDVIHASPPCRAHSAASALQGNFHFDFIPQTRKLLIELGKPYVIENVEGAPLIKPTLLCGASFGMRTYRHRLFESNVPLTAPEHQEHVWPVAEIGRPPRPGEFMSLVGHFSQVDLGRVVMGMLWASREGIANAVPPVYTEHLGLQVLSYLERNVVCDSIAS